MSFSQKEHFYTKIKINMVQGIKKWILFLNVFSLLFLFYRISIYLYQIQIVYIYWQVSNVDS